MYNKKKLCSIYLCIYANRYLFITIYKCICMHPKKIGANTFVFSPTQKK